MGLTAKQQAFVDAYTGEAQGNGTRAAVLAGYSPADAAPAASKLLKLPKIAQAIDEKRNTPEAQAVEAANVANRVERKEFLSSVMRGMVDGASPKDRVKACETLGRMEGDFVTLVADVTKERLAVRLVAGRKRLQGGQ